MLDDSTPDAGFQTLHREAAGMLAVEIIRPQDAARLLGMAVAGDFDAGVLVAATFRALAAVAAAPRRRPALCGCCPRALRTPDSVAAVAIELPVEGPATMALSFAFCARCATEDKLQAAVLAAVRRAWPEARALDPAQVHSTGSAA